MKKLYVLLFLCLVVIGCFLWLFLSGGHKDKEDIEINITDTGFEYDITVCDQYFEMVECIIDNDPNKGWNQEMRLELKSQIKAIQDEWKQLPEQELAIRCTEELENYERSLKENNVDSFGCLNKVN